MFFNTVLVSTSLWQSLSNYYQPANVDNSHKVVFCVPSPQLSPGYHQIVSLGMYQSCVAAGVLQASQR